MIRLLILSVMCVGVLNAAELSAELKLKKTVYELDKAHADKVIKANEKIKKREFPNPPKPLAIDAELVVKNNGKKDVSINVGGDMTSIELILTGKGAVTMPSMMMMTADFRMGKNITLKPGDSHSFKIKSMAHGKRAISAFTYWTQAGSYKLVAKYKSKDHTVSSDAVKITIK